MRVGVLGGGQLARLLAQAGVPLGMKFAFLCPDPHACAAPLGDHLCAQFDDRAALAELAKLTDVVTYEFESVPATAVEWLAERVAVRPSPLALRVAQDRLNERRTFRELGIPTPEFRAVASLNDLRRAAGEIGMPAVLKTRTQGYDGKGQAVLREPADLEASWQAIGRVPAILDTWVGFERELSIIAVRDAHGRIVYYPLSENFHRGGVLRLSLSRAGDPAQASAEAHARRLLERLEYVGALALELFQVGDRLLANEMAPRVHNSGHWTIEGARTSQFENHLRAVCGLPLGDPAIVRPAAMVNLIGCLPAEDEIRAVPGAAPHFYGKTERPGRKVGHVTLACGDGAPGEFERGLARLLELAGEPELASASLANAARRG